MTNSTEAEKLLELADYCEAAMGPSVRLDECIYDAINTPEGVDPLSLDPPDITPAYTNSLDAAMTLVPTDEFGEPVLWQIFSGGHTKPEVRVITDAGEFDASGNTDAIALCAAALRARAAMEPSK